MGKNPDDPKQTSTEIRFWNNGGPHHTWKRGLTWYKSLFSGECAGEKCANYIESPKAMAKLHKHAPDTKLVLCVRNPVDRLLSEFWMQHKKPDKIKKFPKFAKDKRARRRGEYSVQLLRSVFPLFRERQVYIVVQERMKQDLVGEMNRLYAWLGLDNHDAKVIDTSFASRDLPLDGYRTWSTGHTIPMAEKERDELQAYYMPFNEMLFSVMGGPIEEWQ